MKSAEEVLEYTAEMGLKKVNKSLEEKMILGFIGGAMISLGYLAYVRIAATITAPVSGLGSFLGAAVFPIGLIIILLAGGELVTGNMMAVSVAAFKRRISWIDWMKNILTITLANTIGALFVSYFFGHIVGLTNSGVYLEEVLHLAEAKTSASFIQCFFSGIGCNWFVGLSLWLCYAAKDGTTKMIGIWFPVMTFVLIGFQHCVANMFIIPAAIFEGTGTWLGFVQNFIPVFLGNIVGGMIFVGFFYYRVYNKKTQTTYH